MSPTEPTSLIHPTYRHLERTMRLAGLSLARWTQLVVAGAVAYALAHVLPFGGTYNASVAVTIAGVPVAAAVAAGSGAVRPVDVLVATLRWRRDRRLYLPGESPEPTPAGYRLRASAPRPEEGRR